MNNQLMTYYQCECGDAYAWSKTELARCEGCTKCKTTVATAPADHKPLMPHEFKPMADSTVEMCIFCGKKKLIINSPTNTPPGDGGK